MRNIIFGILASGLLIANIQGVLAAGNTFYVDNSGRVACSDTAIDAGSAGHPFCTISKANTTHTPGDTVIIKSGEYRESILPKEGPSADQRTIYSGDKTEGPVMILGSDALENWSLHSPGVYVADFTEPLAICGSYRPDCWEARSDWLTPVSGVSAITESGNFYYDEANHRLYLMPHDTAHLDHGIECSVRNVGFIDGGNWTVENLTFMHSRYDAVVMTAHGGNNISILNNEFAFNSGEGSCANNPSSIHSSAVDNMRSNVRIIGNVVHDQGSDKGPGKDCSGLPGGGEHSGAGIELYSIRDSVIANNEVFNNCVGILLKSCHYYECFRNVAIHNNIVHDGGTGIGLGQSWDSDYQAPDISELYTGTIDGNVVYNMNGGGMDVNWGLNNFKFYHNTIYNTQGVRIGFYGTNNAAIIKNNIISRIPYVDNRSSYFWLYSNVVSTVLLDSNLYFGTSGNFGLTNVNSNENNSTRIPYASFADWRTAYPNQDINSKEADPLLENIDTIPYDFHLRDTSINAIDKGEKIAGYHCDNAYEDYTDENRPINCRHWTGEAPDIGVYEYGLADEVNGSPVPYVPGPGNGGNGPETGGTSLFNVSGGCSIGSTGNHADEYFLVTMFTLILVGTLFILRREFKS